MSGRRATIVISALAALAAASALLGLWFGSGDLSASDRLGALLDPSGGSTAHSIIWGIRFPRVLLALVVGAGLAASGCVLQGMLRNPLADPYTLGVSGGAALGASAAIIAGAGKFLGAAVVPAFAFGGALVTVALVYASARRRDFSAVALVLAGVVLNFLSASLVYLLFALAESSEIHGTMNWLMGDLGSAAPGMLPAAAAMTAAGFAAFAWFSRDLDALSLGDEKALNLGTPPEAVRRALFLAASLVTGACVASSGIIGFVGLIVPHALRPFAGPGHRALLPASALGGAAFLALSDLAARSIPASIAFPEFPVGVVTGIAGGLFLLFLLFTGRISSFF